MKTLTITLDGGKKVSAHFQGHTVLTDQPVGAGGENSAPAPFDLFLASLGTCAGIYVKSFCDQRNLPSDNIRIIQTVEYDPDKRLPSKIGINIQLPPDFPEKYRDAVVNVAQLCAVKRAIADPPVFDVFSSVI